MRHAPSLPEMQRAFAAALVDGEARVLTPWIAARGIDPAARLAIYRNAGFAIHVEALEAVYPALRALVGADSFDGLATRYTARRGSASGNLQGFGRDFPQFVRAQPETAAYPWLFGVARLEWLRQESLLAAQAAHVAVPQLLQELQQAPDESIQLLLQPHVRVLGTGIPVLDLWTWALDPHGDAPDPAGPGQCVLLWRRDTRVHMLALDAERAAFVQALVRGQPLSDALVGEHAPAHLMACLQPLLAHDLIARISTTPVSPTASESRP
jgi:hypothetical protein